jgi:hypothetical protein
MQKIVSQRGTGPRATSCRNTGRHHLGMPGRLRRNPQQRTHPQDYRVSLSFLRRDSAHRRPAGPAAVWRAAQQRQRHRLHALKATSIPGTKHWINPRKCILTPRIRPPFGKGGLGPEGARLADVHNSSLRLGGAGCLSWKLKHCCCLTFRQVRQKLNVPIGKFQCVVVCVRLAFVDLPKDGRGVRDRVHFPTKEATMASSKSQAPRCRYEHGMRAKAYWRGR